MPTQQSTQVDVTLHLSLRTSTPKLTGTAEESPDNFRKASAYKYFIQTEQTRKSDSIDRIHCPLFNKVYMDSDFRGKQISLAILYQHTHACNPHIHTLTQHCPINFQSQVFWDPLSNIFSLSASSCLVKIICSPKRRMFSFFWFCLSMSLITPSRSL